MSYSASALINTAILHNRKDLMNAFLQSINSEHEKEIPFKMFILAKKTFSIGIRPEEMVQYAASFGITNKRYMVSKYSSFISHLSDVMMEKYKMASYPVESLQITELPTTEKQVFANISLKNTFSLPDITHAHKFLEDGAALLQEAHNRVKAETRSSKSC